MPDILAASEPQAVQVGQVVVNTGADVWKTWNNASSLTGAMVGIVLVGGLPGNYIQVTTVGRFPYQAFNLGAGNSGTIVAGFTPSRGSAGTVIGTCDASGELFILPSTVNQASPEAGVPTVAGIASLRKTPNNQSNSIIVQNYATPGDGGGGVFTWNASDIRGDDNGVIIAVSGLATGRWNRSFDNAQLNVRHYGATGNGSTDDTTAIQNTINAANNLGIAVVYIPAGTYIQSAPYTVQNTLTIRGAGEQQTILSNNTFGDGIQTSNPVNGSTAVYTTIERLTLISTALTGVAAWQTGHGYATGTYVVPTCNPASPGSPFKLSNKVLKCTSAGTKTSGSIEPTGQLFTQIPSGSTLAPVVTLNATGALTTDHTLDVQISNVVGNTVTYKTSVDGAAWSGGSTFNQTAGTTTSTIAGTQYTITFPIGTYQNGTFYWTPTFRWALSNISITEAGASAPTWQVQDAGAGYHDIGSSYVRLDRVRIAGYAIGCILDQTEDGTISRCTFGGGAITPNTVNVGIWLVNGAAAQPDAATQPGSQFTNVIRIRECYLGSATVAIVDDGGLHHNITGCDIAASTIACCGPNNATFTVYCEAPTLTLQGGSACAFRILPWGFFTRANQPGQGPISVTDSTLSLSAAYVSDASTIAYNGNSAGTQTAAAQLAFERNFVTTSKSAWNHSNGGNVATLIWRQNFADNALPAADYEPTNLILESGQEGFVTPVGRVGGNAFGLIVDGIPRSTMDIGGGLTLRPYAWDTGVTFTTGNNDNVNFAYGHATMTIQNVSGNFTLSGINANGVGGGTYVKIINNTGHSMTVGHTNSNTANNNIRLVAATSQILGTTELVYLANGVDGFTGTSSWYQVSTAGGPVTFTGGAAATASNGANGAAPALVLTYVNCVVNGVLGKIAVYNV